MPQAIAARPREEAVRRVLAGVADPEIPVLSIVDLGIVRSVCIAPDGTVEVGLSPTYSGCPATEVIRRHVSAALRTKGFDAHRVFDVLSPPWTSDWITTQGRAKLLEYGIVPPAQSVAHPRHLRGEVPIAFVELHDGAAFDEGEVRAFCRQNMPQFKVPRAIHVLDALPRNPTGKVLRRELAERVKTL